MNAPEIHHSLKGEEPGGREAATANRLLVGGRHVRLELDVRARDRYGRLLAYVWIGDTMINAELVRLGYAQAMTVPPNVRYRELFVALQRDARSAGRGLWRLPGGAATGGPGRPEDVRFAPPPGRPVSYVQSLREETHGDQA